MAETNLWERDTQRERERGIIETESTEYRRDNKLLNLPCNGNF